MSSETLLKCFFAGLLALVFAWEIFYRCDPETGSENDRDSSRRCRPYVSGLLLPLWLAVLMVLGLWEYGARHTAAMMLSMLFGLFLHICIYDAVLLLALPFLRKHISARACAELWMLPNYLYITQASFMKVSKPFWVVYAPERLVWGLFFVWVAGFVLVFAGKLAAHLVFRRRLLKGARVIEDPVILEVLRREILAAAYAKPKFRLVESPQAVSPLSIGLFKRSTRIVLPRRSFSEEELSLIFRHELIHIGREDAWSKFFQMFCTAVCWFNPFMWFAMRKSADDLELSCDEAVLLGCSEAVRRQYAELILSTAGDDRGFTTSLSSSATALRYRLRAVVKPLRRKSGALTVGLAFFVLCMSFGYVGLAYGRHTGREILFPDREPSQYTLYRVYVEGGTYEPEADPVDAAAIREYLADLTLVNMTGNYSFSDSDRTDEFWYTGPEGTFVVKLYTSYLKILPLYEEKLEWNVYYLPDAVDWDLLDTLVPPLPVVEARLYRENDTDGMVLRPTITKFIRRPGSEERVLKSKELQEGEGSGIFGAVPVRAEFSFSWPVLSDVRIRIETWDHTKSREEILSCQDGRYVLSTPEGTAHYTVCASLLGQDENVYEAEFYFDVEK